MDLWNIAYLFLLSIIFFFGLKKISNLTDKLVIYHRQEKFIERVSKVFMAYGILGLIAFIVMYILFTFEMVSNLFNTSLAEGGVIAITLFASLILIFLTRMCSLLPEKGMSDYDYAKRKERVAKKRKSQICP